jgi:hypothetical protein
MFFVTELSEAVKAQKYDKDGKVTGEVIIPKGTKISIQDTGDNAEVLAPVEYSGLMFKSGNININEDLKQ